MSLPWFIISTLSLLVLVSVIYQRNALKKLSYSRYFSASAVYQGEQIEMVEEIVNRKLLPLPWLRLESSLARGLEFASQDNLGVSSGEIYQNHISLFYLRSYRHIRRRHQIRCTQRGLFRLESVTMTTGDLFGMSRNSKQFPLQLELLVYPQMMDIYELPLPVHSWLGELPVKRWIVEDPFLTAGTREYRPGDSLGAMNWKATARTGVMQVHQKDHTADVRLIICLNVENSDNMWRNITDTERIELGIRYAATVAEYADGHGLEIGLMSNGRLDGETDAVNAAQAGSLLEMLGLLARLQLDRTLPMSRLLELEAENSPSDRDYLIISCHRGAELMHAAEELRLLGNGVAWLDIPGEGRDSA
ncbi:MULTISPECIES: DUF58 domain-containing protein [unclassified Paenibacillus]|uniref:DUF58 domain-containing protein n=1 Tax=unclassified Paenibacillus TaxID=185978 RepID=UPI002406B033|nr:MULTISPECIES: DUF58 domain-containing protein [unclassified Paenibacillus]MDF9839160.1 uncharacterized protein (DUF58 family) [Paenibacillus sp. PastF-2]MDF9845742.1 uncharacterized protein (DUF58 family) [Paenibacillus sp. PastM-2]MDF9852314.1 uncharacterized protein (DUF58 family) [Paenibacillus sp. PastF-1]MDH6477956.1 uncharacterized protein (DUF58 family) [Paenibacillus sp. PastH-2]MDH6505693.1 uncharacterized protein (DUF58 family) [Paenibacillus sp. PastM-3]